MKFFYSNWLRPKISKIDCSSVLISFCFHASWVRDYLIARFAFYALIFLIVYFTFFIDFFVNAFSHSLSSFLNLNKSLGTNAIVTQVIECAFFIVIFIVIFTAIIITVTFTVIITVILFDVFFWHASVVKVCSYLYQNFNIRCIAFSAWERRIISQAVNIIIVIGCHVRNASRDCVGSF